MPKIQGPVSTTSEDESTLGRDRARRFEQRDGLYEPLSGRVAHHLAPLDCLRLRGANVWESGSEQLDRRLGQCLFDDCQFGADPVEPRRCLVDGVELFLRRRSSRSGRRPRRRARLDLRLADGELRFLTR